MIRSVEENMRSARYASICLALVLGCGPAGGGGGGGGAKGADTSSPADGSDEGGFVVSDVPGAGDAPESQDPGGAPADIPPPEDEGSPPPDVGPVPDPGQPPPDEGVPQDDGGPKPPPGKVVGGVWVGQVEMPDLKVGSVEAGFGYGALPEPTTVAVEGPCKVVVGSGSRVPTTGGLDSGTIVLVGLNQEMALYPKNQGGGFVYESGLSEEHPSILGTAPNVGMSASGGAHVPAWNVVVPVPVPVQLFAPAAEQVQKDKPLTIQWNPANGTQARIDIFVYDGMKGEAKGGNTIACQLPADTGSHTVPASLMKKLPGGGGFMVFDYVVWVVSRVVMLGTPLPDGVGEVTTVVSRSNGGAAQLAD